MNEKTRFFEELSLNAHCAMKVQFYDGWILRANEGHTKRANSVSPLYDSALGMDTKIRSCEEFYKKAGLPCIFKLTDDDTELDEMLKKARDKGLFFMEGQMMDMYHLISLKKNGSTHIVLMKTA